MKLLHFTNEKFDRFDPEKLGSATIERQDDYDAFVDVSNFGFCFVRPEDEAYLVGTYGKDFGKYIAVCDFDADKNNSFESTYDDFVAWVDRDGTDAVKSELKDEGVEYLYLDNGNFVEIIPLNINKVKIEAWKENK